MSFKFDPTAADRKAYVSKPGTYTCKVQSVKYDYLPPSADFYAKVTLLTKEGELTTTDIFLKPDRNGEHARLQQFVAATATKDEIAKLLARGEFDVDEAFIRQIGERSIGRSLEVKVTERKYKRKDGTEGVAYSGSFFNRLVDGPETDPF